MAKNKYMDYRLRLSLFLLIICSVLKAQDSVSFTMHYLPEHRYTQSSLQKMSMRIEYSGSDSVLNALKENGMPNPVINDYEVTMKTVTTTGKLNEQKKMPITMEFTQANNQKGTVIIPKGTKMVGSVEENKMPVFNSIESKDMDESTKETFLKTFQNTLAQIPLPDKKMIAGDEFSQNIPISLPVGSVTLKMDIHTTYKLISVTDKLANFDITMKCTLNYEEFSATGGGTGDGIMTFSREKGYPLKNNLQYKMNITATEGPVIIKLTMTSKSEQEYTINN
jgi:hypothetical protein